MRRYLSFSVAATLLLLTGCASIREPDDPERKSQTVSLVNSLSWTNPMSGKRDGLRSAWPLATLDQHTEYFPLAQVRHCDKPAACRWGVLNARRSIGKIHYLPGGVTLELDLMVDVDRHQQVQRPELNAAMTIPADVPALSVKRPVKQALVLEYGKVHHIDFDYGIGFDLCVTRLDEARKSIDNCEIAFF
jgi:uncharacterized protein YceK